MALHQSVLLKKAKKREFKDLAKCKITPAPVSGLDQLLNDVYFIRRPKPVDYSNRRDLVRIFNAMAKEIYGNSDDFPVVEGFGSFVMDMFSAESDLDLSVNFSSNAIEVTREKKIKTLRKFAKKLYSLQVGGHVTGIQTIMTARVPIVKVIDCGTRIECDLSVENKDGITKSQIIHVISAIDERFQKLSFLMKAWAKAHGINSSKDRTLNSLSIISLVAFHLQTQDPPILPPFSALFKDGTDPAIVMKMAQNYLNYGTSNKESLGKLFVTLFVKLASVEKLWRRGLCASLYEGSWISKIWDSHIGSISVEDFTDRSQNVARAVGTQGVKKIYNCIRRSLHHLFAFLDGQVDGPKLREHLFGKDVIPTVVNRVTTNPEKKIDDLPVHHDFRHTKKMRLTEGWRGTQFAEGWGSAHIAKGWGVTQHTKGWGQTQCAEGWGGTQLADGPHIAKGWGGTQNTKGWGQTQCAEGWGGTQLAGVWGRKQEANGWRGKLPVDGWGGTQQSYGEILSNPGTHLRPHIPYLTPQVASSFNNTMCNGPLKLPSVPIAKPRGSEGSSIPLLQQSLVSPQNSLGFDVSHNLNPRVPMPYCGPIYSLDQPRSIPRR